MGVLKVYDKQKPSFEIPPDVGHTLNRGLIAHWTTQESGGRILYDRSGYGHHGTLDNMSPVNAWVIDPERGRVLEFDGANDYLTTASTATVIGTSGPFSVAAWAKNDGSLNVREGIISSQAIFGTGGWDWRL